MNTSFDKFRDKTTSICSTTTTKTNIHLGSISNTAEALALSPAAAKRMSNPSNMSSRNNSQTLNANQLFSVVQSNAQKIGTYKHSILFSVLECNINREKMIKKENG